MSEDHVDITKTIGIVVLMLIVFCMITQRMSNMDEEKYNLKFTTGEYKHYVKEALLSKEDIEKIKKGIIINDIYVKGDNEHKYQMLNINNNGCEAISKNEEFFLWNAHYFTGSENNKKYYLINANPSWNRELIGRINFSENNPCEVIEVNKE